MMSEEIRTREEALAYLTRPETSGLVPCSRYGRNSEECAPVAVALTWAIGNASGSYVSVSDELEHAMSLVVNDSPDVADTIWDYAESPADRELVREIIWERTLDRVRDAGLEAGSNAAAYWSQETIGGRTSGDVRPVAERVIAGIDDCDPEIMDSLPTADLSGQWADGPTVESVASDAEWSFDDRDDDDCAMWERDEIFDAYCDAFNEAAQTDVYAACERVLSDD